MAIQSMFAKISSLLAALCMIVSCVAVEAPTQSELLYRETSAVTLPSSSTGWDYIKFQPGSARLFMARLNDGLTIFDVDKMEVLRTQEGSVGANGPIILPELDRAIIAMVDGSVIVMELSTLRTIGRVELVEGRVINSGSLDEATGRLHLTTGIGDENTVWIVIDPETGREINRKVFPFRKMDDPAPDGEGLIFAPVQIDHLILALDSDTLEERARWDIGCRVSKLRFESDSKRLIGACRGPLEESEVFIFDPETGQKTARVPIGMGVDAVVIDRDRNRIITSDGESGFLSVVAYQEPDKLTLLGRVNLRIGSRMMDIDQRSGKLYVVNADFTLRPDRETGAFQKLYHPDTFKVQEFSPE
jgi:hypothetical protein